jgi:iron complex outermembrane receptor protein
MRFRRPPFRFLPFSTLALALLAASHAFAETPTDAAAAARDAKTLDAVRVVGQADGYAARETNAGTKTDTPLAEVPQAISVITAAQLRDQNARSLQEALRYTSGVRTDQYGLDNRGDWYSLRGGSSGTTLLDGMRLPLTGYYGVIREEPYAFERIEVLHGPSSVMAGQNAPGGVLNLVRKRPQPDASREISLQIGSRDHRQIAVDATGPLNAGGSLSYRVVGLARDNDTQVDYADDHRRYLAPSLLWAPDDATSLLVYAEYQKDRNRNTNGFFPIEGTLLPSRSGRIPLDRFVGEPAWDRNGGERTRIGYAFAHAFGETWTLRHDLRYDDLRGGFRSIYADFDTVDYLDPETPKPGGAYMDVDQRLLRRLSYGSDDHGRIANADLLLEGRLGSGRVTHHVLVGVDALASRTEQWLAPDAFCMDASGTAPSLFDVYAPVYGTCAEPVVDHADPATHSLARIRQAGIIVQDQVKVDERWVFVAGARRDYVETDSTYAGDRSIVADRAWTKHLGAVYLADGGWSPYVNYAESFQPVAGQSADGDAFSPSRGRQAEAGVKWMPEGRRFSASAAVYKLEETGRLSPDPDNVNFSVQRGRVDAKGLELEASGSVGGWDLIASFTRSKTIDRSTGFRFESTPETTAALWAVRRFESLPGLRIGGGVRYVGKTWDGEDALVTPSNTLYDAMASYDVGAWRLSLNAVNLTDKTYFSTCGSRGDCWFGLKRRVVAEAAYRW